MKIRIEGDVFEGTPAELIDRFRRASFRAEDFPDSAGFLQHMQNQFIRMTELACILPDGDLDARAKAMLERLADIDALEIIDDE